MAERYRAAIPLTDIGFCHLVVGVTDMDRALAFYWDLPLTDAR
jgi:hypothetical protein